MMFFFFHMCADAKKVYVLQQFCQQVFFLWLLFGPWDIWGFDLKTKNSFGCFQALCIFNTCVVQALRVHFMATTAVHLFGMHNQFPLSWHSSGFGSARLACSQILYYFCWHGAWKNQFSLHFFLSLYFSLFLLFSYSFFFGNMTILWSTHVACVCVGVQVLKLNTYWHA